METGAYILAFPPPPPQGGKINQKHGKEIKGKERGNENEEGQKKGRKL